MTWIIEFVLRISMGVLGGALFGIGAGLLWVLFIGIVLPNHNLLIDLTAELNNLLTFFTDNSKHIILKLIIVASMINAILGMVGSSDKSTNDDNDIDLRKENEDWWFDTQELEIYGHKI